MSKIESGAINCGAKVTIYFLFYKHIQDFGVRVYWVLFKSYTWKILAHCHLLSIYISDQKINKLETMEKEDSGRSPVCNCSHDNVKN